jgi:hypothetical protein
MDVPRSRTDDPLASILATDRVELVIDKLGDISDKGKDLANTVINQGEGAEEVDHGCGDRLRVLHRVFSGCLKWGCDGHLQPGTRVSEGVTPAQDPTSLVENFST